MLTRSRDCPGLRTPSTFQRRSAAHRPLRGAARALAGGTELPEQGRFFSLSRTGSGSAPVSPATLARIAQLTQKTNQFNLTTQRHTEQQIAEMAACPDWQVLAIKVRDRFGDHGLVGVAITRDEAETCNIETFLLSCRVIGRNVETALLSHLALGAATRGRRRLAGRFVSTRKNAAARDFYARHGFQVLEENSDGSVWTLDLQHHTIATPEWIRLKTSPGESN